MVQIRLEKAESKAFYKLLNDKTHIDNQTGTKRSSKSLSLNEDVWCKMKNSSKENKLKEFHFRFIHRTIVMKRKLFRSRIMMNARIFGQNDSITKTFALGTFFNGSTQQTRVRSPQQQKKCYLVYLEMLFVLRILAELW